MPYELLEEVGTQPATKPFIQSQGAARVAQEVVSPAVHAISGFLGVPASLESTFMNTIRNFQRSGQEQQHTIWKTILGPDYEQQLAAAGHPLAQEPIEAYQPGLPNAQQIRSMVAPAFGGDEYFKATNPISETLNKGAEFMGSLLFPVGGAIKPAQAAKISLGYALGHGAGKLANLGEKGQEVAGLGGAMVSTVVGPWVAANAAKNFFKEGEKAAETVTIKPTASKTALDKSYKSLEKSISPSQEDMVKLINDMSNTIDPFNHKANALELWKRKKELSEWFGKVKTPTGKNVLKTLNDAILEDIKTASKENPGLYNLVKGNEIYKTMEQSAPFVESISNHIGKVAKGHPLLYFLLGQAGMGIGSLAALVGGGELASSIAPNIEKIIRNKEYAKLFGNLWQSVAAKNSDKIFGNINRINNFLNKNYPDLEETTTEQPSGKYELLEEA